MAHLENLKFWRGDNLKAKAEISFYDCEAANGKVHPERASLQAKLVAYHDELRVPVQERKQRHLRHLLSCVRSRASRPTIRAGKRSPDALPWPGPCPSDG